MDRKLGGLALAVLSFSTVAQEAPFCVVSQNGAARNCIYHDLNSCRDAAQILNGMCATNGNPGQGGVNWGNQRQPDVAGAYQRGLASGNSAREDRRPQQAAASAPVVFYDCRAAGGDAFTDVAAVGCSVVHIEP